MVAKGGGTPVSLLSRGAVACTKVCYFDLCLRSDIGTANIGGRQSLGRCSMASLSVVCFVVPVALWLSWCSLPDPLTWWQLPRVGPAFIRVTKHGPRCYDSLICVHHRWVEVEVGDAHRNLWSIFPLSVPCRDEGLLAAESHKIGVLLRTIGVALVL